MENTETAEALSASNAMESAINNQQQPQEPQATEAPQVQPPQNAPWYGDLQDEGLTEWAKNKNFNSAAHAMRSYQNLEKFMGADKAGRGVIIPKEGASDQELNDFYNKIGRPSDAAGYELPIPEGQENTDFANAMSQIMYESGVPKNAAQNLAKAWNEYNVQALKQHNEAQEVQFLQEEASLKKEWGAAYESKIAQAGIAARQFGVDGDKIDALQQALGFDGTMKFFNDLSSYIGEDKFIGGNRGGEINYATDALSPEEAETKWNQLMADQDFITKAMNGDPQAIMIKSNVARHRK